MKATGFLIFTHAFLLASGLLTAAESRTWTFIDDGYISSGPGIWSFRKGGRIDGRFVRLDGTNSVIVKLVDGTARTVPYASLSPADQAYLTRLKRRPNAATPEIAAEPARLATPPKNDLVIFLVDVVDHGSTPDFPYLPLLRTCELPKTKEASAACQDILLELHQIQKRLEPEIGFEQFSQLLQKETSAIRRIQNTGHGIPAEFSGCADRCLSYYQASKAAWQRETESGTDREKRDSRAAVQRNWIKAEMEILRCEGICQNDPTVNDEILAKESMLVYTDKKLEGMTTVEIFDRFRNLITQNK
jgi:hypothetical protein